MRGIIRVGVVAAAALGSTAFFGAQMAGAAKTPSYLGVYQATNVAVTSMSVEFSVPHFTCTAPNEFLSAYADTFDQSNGSQTAFDGGYVQIGCTDTKKAVIYPLLQVNGAYTQPTLKVKKGNLIQVSVTCGGAESGVTLTDVTTGLSASEPAPTTASCNGAWEGNIGVTNGKGTKVLPLPSFGAFDFSAANVNGNAFGALNPTAVSYKEGTNVIKVGALTGGTSWVNTQKS
jgi:hypothetical protein